MAKDKQDEILRIPFDSDIKFPETKHEYKSFKTYNHSIGLSCVFRQHRAAHSHCQYLHGYSLKVEIEFCAWELDERNWVQDFGGLKALKEWLEQHFDHKTLVAKDDPQISIFRELHIAKMVQLVEVPSTGIEAFARIVYEKARELFENDRVDVMRVRIWEHEGNSAEYGFRK